MRNAMDNLHVLEHIWFTIWKDLAETIVRSGNIPSSYDGWKMRITAIDDAWQQWDEAQKGWNN